MAITLVGTPVASSTASGASLNVALEAGIAAGELLQIAVETVFQVTISTPAGWSVSNPTTGDAFGTINAASFWKIADGSEGGTSVTVTVGGTADINALSWRMTGHFAGSPINATGTPASGTSGSTTALTTPSVTTTVANAVVQRMAFVTRATDIPVPGGQTNIGLSTTGSAYNTGTLRAVFSTQATAGASGTLDLDATATDNAWVGFTIAIAPAAGGTGPTITSHPAQHTVASGSTATFSVAATGSGALSYQWWSAPATYGLSNAPGVWSAISGATSASYTTPSVSSGDLGKWYRCVITDTDGSITTNHARLFLLNMGVTGTGAMEFGTGWMMRFRSMRQQQSNQLVRKRLFPGDTDATEATVWGDFLLPASSGPTPVTGTLNVTEAADTVSASGTISGGAVTGTLNVTEAADTGSGTGSVVISATANVTEAADTASASETVLVSASLSVTESADTLSGSAGVPVSGSLGITEAADTLSGSGTIGTPPVTGSLNVTESADTLSSTGSVLIGASSNVTNGADTLSSTGTVAVSATLSVVEGADTLSGTGTVLVSGSDNATEAPDTLSASATVSLLGVSAVLNATEAPDTLSGTAAASIAASFGATEAPDTLAGTISVPLATVTGTLTVTEAPDTLAGTLFNPASGSVNYYGSGKQAGNRSLIDQVIDKYDAIERARKSEKPVSQAPKPDKAFQDAENALKKQKAKEEADRKAVEEKAKRQVEEIKAKAEAAAKAKAEMRRKAFPPMEMPHAGEAKRLRDAAIEDEQIMRLMATMLLED